VANGDRGPQCTIALFLSQDAEFLAARAYWASATPFAAFRRPNHELVLFSYVWPAWILRFWRWPSVKPWRRFAVWEVFCRDPHFVSADGDTIRKTSCGHSFLGRGMFAALFAIVPLRLATKRPPVSWTPRYFNLASFLCSRQRCFSWRSMRCIGIRPHSRVCADSGGCLPGDRAAPSRSVSPPKTKFLNSPQWPSRLIASHECYSVESSTRM